MPSLVLGPVTFGAFELPPDIVFGGRQRLSVHPLTDGGRVVDAMGRDDAPLAWSGAFSGPDAAARARALDQLRADGAALPALWADFAYTVVIADFAARYERANWVPYRIVCTVVADETATSAAPAATPLALLQADLAQATALTALDLSVATAALAAPGALTAGSAANAAARGSIAAAGAAIDAGLAAANAGLIADAPFASLAGAAANAAVLAAARGFVARARTNLAATGS